MKKTYIVYSFYASDRSNKETDRFFKEMKIRTLPTIIVFNDGKEVRRHMGEVSKDKVLKGIETRKEQKGGWFNWSLW